LFEIPSPQKTYEEESQNRGVFHIEPLERGFGHTFGNSLRRVLLSSIAGVAVTAVRIDGVHHEFSSIPGVKEDVTDIILNLRELVFRLEGASDEVEVEIVVNGPRMVTAADIVCSADLEIVNPDLHIAELMDDGRLDMILTVSRGRGYRLGEEKDNQPTTIGVIPVDSNFSPVRRVRYEVSAARVGQRTDFDKLTLEVETNGAIDPQQALSDAAKVLSERLTLFLDPEDVRALGESVAIPEDQPGGQMHDILIEELELGVRSYNCLKRVGVETIGDLISKTDSELSAIPNFGRKSIEEVKENLARHGLALRG
jgi:DNA-directed RNA polymerase subunit alpha